MRKRTNHPVPRDEIDSGTKEHKPVIKIPQQHLSLVQYGQLL